MAEIKSPCSLDGDTDCGLLGLDKEKRVCCGLNRAKDECSVWIQGGDDSVCCSQCKVCPKGCGAELVIDCGNADAMTAFLLNTECDRPLDPTLGTTSQPTGRPAPSQATRSIVPPSPGRTPIPKYPSTFWPTPEPVYDGLRYCSGKYCWEQVRTDLEAPRTDDGFGDDIALADSSKRFLVSALEAGSKSGAVYVYSLESDGTSFQQVGQTMYGSSGDELQGRISRDGYTLIVGRPWKIVNCYINRGQAVVYRLSPLLR